MFKLVFYCLLAALVPSSCRDVSLSKKYYEVVDVTVSGVQPSIDKLMEINRRHRIGAASSNIDILIAPTHRGYKIIIESNDPITSTVSSSVYSQVVRNLDSPGSGVSPK
jgi:hypothetical protein